MELLLDQTGGKMTHIPYKGLGPAITDLLAGRVQVMFSTLGAIEPHLKSGAVRAYGVSSPKRLPQLPDVPTLAEQGVKGYEAAAWQGLIAPPGVPAATVERLNASLRRVLAMDETKKRMQSMGIEPISGTPKEFADYATAQAKLWSSLVKSRDLKVE